MRVTLHRAIEPCEIIDWLRWELGLRLYTNPAPGVVRVRIHERWWRAKGFAEQLSAAVPDLPLVSSAWPLLIVADDMISDAEVTFP